MILYLTRKLEYNDCGGVLSHYKLVTTKNNLGVFDILAKFDIDESKIVDTMYILIERGDIRDMSRPKYHGCYSSIEEAKSNMNNILDYSCIFEIVPAEVIYEGE